MAAVAVSHTAPEISLAELEEERKALSEQEAADVIADVHGTHGAAALSVKASANTAAALERMQVVLDSMRPDEKQVYLEAVEVCPELVENETSFIKFLRATDYDPKAAAAKLVKNWDVRKQLFGDRAFLPLRLEHGAMNDEDIEAFELGAVQLMPKDAAGRNVIYSQCHRCPKMSRANPVSLRVIFYLLHLLAKDEEAQKQGYVLIIDTRSMVHNLVFDRKLVGLYVSTTTAACPLRMRAQHIIYSDPKAVAKIYLPAYLWFCGPFVRLRARFHTGCPDELRIDLGEYGLPDVNNGDAPLMPSLGIVAELKAMETRNFEHESN